MCTMRHLMSAVLILSVSAVGASPAAQHAIPSTRCQAEADAYCATSCLPAIESRPCGGPQMARLSGGVQGASEAWRCYSPETLDAKNESYASGTCYCTRDAPIRAMLDRCANPPPFTPVDAFLSGADGYHTYRIPSLVTATNGDLLLFAEGRKFSSTDHDWNDIVMKRSTDGGKTWGAMQVVYSESSPTKHVTIGNPAPVVLHSEPGTVLLVMCRENKAVLQLMSADHGATWSANASDISTR